MVVRNRTLTNTRSSRWITLLSLAIILMLVLAACSSPGDEDDPTATTEPVAEEPTATEAPPEEPDPTATPEPDPTATPTEEPSATPTATPEPTETPVPPTATPIPEPPVQQQGGAEFRIEGKSVSRVIAGDAEGTILYAFTDVGISRSNDAGRTWFASGDLPEGEVIIAINNPEVLYAGARGSCGMGTSETPLTRSTDGGREWETFTAGEGIEPYVVEAGDSSIVIGADCGLQFSVDGGQSWETVEGSEGMDFFTATNSGDTLGDEIIAVGVTEGGTGRLFPVDMSDPANPVLGEAIAQFWGAAAIDQMGERIVIATAARTGVSEDRGANWQWSRAGLEDATYSVDPLLEGIPLDETDKVINFTVAEMDPTNPDRIWIGGAQGAFLSLDAGQTWRRIGDIVETTGITIAPTAERVFVSAAGGTRVWTLDGQ